MTNHLFPRTTLWLIFAASIAASRVNGFAQSPESPRERVSLNADWRFQAGDPEGAADRLSYAKLKDAIIASSAGFLQPGATSNGAVPVDLGSEVSFTQTEFNDSDWRKLNLPHDWGIEGPFNQDYPGETGKLPWWGVGWYRKHFNLPAVDQGKRFYLDIDGAMSYATVWCNGQFVGGWPYGYASFRLDLTPHLKAGGENVLSIRLDNPKASSRWYPGGGIYRNVWLVKTAPAHVAHWGTSITTPKVSQDLAEVELKATIDNHAGAKMSLTAKTTLFEVTPDGHEGALVVTSPAATVNIDAHTKIAFTIPVKNPKLWSLEKPSLYRAVTTLEQDGKVIDRYEDVFGIRTIQFTADNGFLLNGKRIPIQGVCNHHDLGALGAAFNTRAAERQIEILKEMGVNAIRSAHNPPAPELLDLCDRMGMLVWDEFSDTWKKPKKPNGYGLLFEDWAEKDMRAMVRRDRNHPSVILWSNGNEISETTSPVGIEMSTKLASYAHEEDPSRPVTAGCNHVQAGYNGLQKTLDVMGYNYKPWEYGKFRKANPDEPLIGSETSSCISSRGEYFFPVTYEKSGGKADFQMSSYDLFAPGWATPPDWEFKGQDQYPFVAGEFVWTGFDYLGEPTPYNSDTTNLLNYQTPEAKAAAEKELKELGKIRVPSRSSYFGIVDLAGFKKDRFYLYQSRWQPDLPMAHILPHWNWQERIGEVTPVHVYTSGDEAELFLNDKSLGKKKKQEFEYRLRWDDVKYEPGELKVVAYKAGQKWAEDAVKTTGPATKLILAADHEQIRADGRDLSFVTVTVADKDSLLVPRSKNQIKFEVTGPGEIVATDNGDATDHALFSSKERKAFNGLALAIVRSKPGETGEVVVRAVSEGLEAATVKINAKP